MALPEVAGSMPAPATIHTINNREMNKILTLTVKPEQLAEVASGEKTTITREIRPQTSSKYIEYFDEYGRVYKTYEEVPDEIEVDVRPLPYDALHLKTSAADSPEIVVAVKEAKIFIVTEEDENGNTYARVYEYKGKEYVSAQIDYILGAIIESNV